MKDERVKSKRRRAEIGEQDVEDRIVERLSESLLFGYSVAIQWSFSCHSVVIQL